MSLYKDKYLREVQWLLALPHQRLDESPTWVSNRLAVAMPEQLEQWRERLLDAPTWAAVFGGLERVHVQGSTSMVRVNGKKVGWLLLAGLGLLAASTAFAGGLNDTGQTTCYDDTGPVSPEPGTHPRQDCTVGRDAAAADGVLPKTGAGGKGFDYTKIASNGGVLPASASSWNCVRDNLTGLTWEVKTNDGGLRDMDWRYTWYDDIHTDNNGGDPGYTGSNTCGGILPDNECNTQAYAAAVNAAGLCGQRDWRLPTVRELQGLVDYGIPYPGPTIDTAYFPNTGSYVYWSSSPYASYPAYAWNVYFYHGGAGADYKSYDGHARLVRGGQ